MKQTILILGTMATAAACSGCSLGAINAFESITGSIVNTGLIAIGIALTQLLSGLGL